MTKKFGMLNLKSSILYFLVALHRALKNLKKETVSLG